MSSGISFTTNGGMTIKTDCFKITDVLTVILEDGSEWKCDILLNADQFDSLPEKYHMFVLNNLLGRLSRRLIDLRPIEGNTGVEFKKPWWRFW